MVFTYVYVHIYVIMIIFFFFGPIWRYKMNERFQISLECPSYKMVCVLVCDFILLSFYTKWSFHSVWLPIWYHSLYTLYFVVGFFFAIHLLHLFFRENAWISKYDWGKYIKFLTHIEYFCFFNMDSLYFHTDYDTALVCLVIADKKSPSSRVKYRSRNKLVYDA